MGGNKLTDTALQFLRQMPHIEYLDVGGTQRTDSGLWSLLLTRTPDAMRGRVAAVNTLFVGASNELGGFESGLAAQLFGPVIAVSAGGIGTILVVLLVALLWPEMRRLGVL